MKEAQLEIEGALSRVALGTSNPQIFHVDVMAMYPNIIITNRLQPTSIVNDKICANCQFDNETACKKQMGWQYKAKVLPVSKKVFDSLKAKIPNFDIKTYCKQNGTTPTNI